MFFAYVSYFYTDYASSDVHSFVHKKETHEYHESLIIQRQSSLFTVIEVTNLFCHPFFFILKKLLIGKKIIKNM